MPSVYRSVRDANARNRRIGKETAPAGGGETPQFIDDDQKPEGKELGLLRYKHQDEEAKLERTVLGQHFRGYV